MDDFCFACCKIHETLGKFEAYCLPLYYGRFAFDFVSLVMRGDSRTLKGFQAYHTMKQTILSFGVSEWKRDKSGRWNPFVFQESHNKMMKSYSSIWQLKFIVRVMNSFCWWCSASSHQIDKLNYSSTNGFNEDCFCFSVWYCFHSKGSVAMNCLLWMKHQIWIREKRTMSLTQFTYSGLYSSFVKNNSNNNNKTPVTLDSNRVVYALYIVVKAKYGISSSTAIRNQTIQFDGYIWTYCKRIQR